MSSANTSTSPSVSEVPQYKSGRAVWTAAADYSFVHTLATHTVCNSTAGLVLKHKYVDPSIIEFAEESLNKKDKLEDIARLLESKFPNKRAEHRSVECLSLLVELRSKTPEFTFHQLNHKHINMWTRTIVPFRHLFDSGLLFKGKSIFHKDCKRFTKCIIDFLTFSASKAASSGIENAFTRGPNQGNKLLEQWLGIMLGIHKSNMADFLYKCAARLARTYINCKQPQTITKSDQEFLLEQNPQIQQLLPILKSYISQINEYECIGANSGLDISTPVSPYQQALSNYSNEQTRHFSNPAPSVDVNARMYHKQSPRFEPNGYYASSASPQVIYRTPEHMHAHPQTNRRMEPSHVAWEPRIYNNRPDGYHQHSAYYSPEYRHSHADHHMYEPEYAPVYYPQEPRWVEDRYPPYYSEYRHAERRYPNPRSHPYSRPANLLPHPKPASHLWNQAQRNAMHQSKDYYPSQHNHSRPAPKKMSNTAYSNSPQTNSPISKASNNDTDVVSASTCTSPNACLLPHNREQRSQSFTATSLPKLSSIKAMSEECTSPRTPTVAPRILAKPSTLADAKPLSVTTPF